MTLAFNMFFFDPWPAATASNPVGWEVPPPDLVRPTGTRPAATVPGEDGIEAEYIAPSAPGFVPDTPAILRAIRQTMPSFADLPLSGRVGLEWGFQTTESPPSISVQRRLPYAELPRLDVPQLALFGMDWVSGSSPSARPKRDPVDLLQYGSFGPRVGLEWGFQEVEAVPSLLPARRHAYAELPRFDAPQLTLAGVDLVMVPLPIVPPKRPDVESAQYSWLGQRVDLQWGFQQYAAVPTLNLSRRHPYAELPQLDTPQLALGGVDWVLSSLPSGRPKRHPLDLATVDFPQLVSPFNWQPICDPPIRSPYRRTALHRDFGIEAAFNEPRLFGWANAPPDLTRPRYRPSDPGGPVDAMALATAALEWGFEVVAVVPSRHPFFRAAAGFPYWFGDVGEYRPVAALTLWVPDNEIQILRPRSGGFRQILIMGGTDASGIFFPTPPGPGGHNPQSGFYLNFGRMMNRGTR